MDNREKAVAWLIAPYLSLIVILVAYVISFIVAQTSTNPALSVISFFLGLLGLLAVFGIPAGIIVAAGLLRKDSKTRALTLQSHPLYKGLSPEQISYILQWSWGAFFGQWIWAFGNRLYLWGLGYFVPLWNIYIFFKVAIEGRKLAWEKGGWKNFEEFKKRQKVMTWVIVGIFILTLLLNAVITSIVTSHIKSS